MLKLFWRVWMSALFCGAVGNVFGWGQEGHMVVAQMAYNHLTPEARTRCDRLIAIPLEFSSNSTSNFVTAACWADDFRSNLGTAIWHYIDIPFSLDGTPTNGVGGASFDAVRAIRQCVVGLQNPNLPQTLQATNLRYLLHFVGDLHQPLHACTAVSASSPHGDAGGNGFSVGGSYGNLHSLWDAGGGYLNDSVSRPLSNTGRMNVSNRVAEVEAAHPFVSNPGSIPDPMDWAVEGWLLAQSVCYAGISENTTPSASYLASAKSTSKERLGLAGERLGNLLNTLFTTPAPFLVASLSSNGLTQISWNAVPGRNYLVQSKAIGANLWVDLTNITATVSNTIFADTLSSEARYYRVAVTW